ncbi:hypothetical protein BgAZ_201500 [Babesia gibsoni]|uniref:Uncharacterized protein n=1 Tax=Babesia gibsoni TaxID=33632 RepID=A0AAD8LLX8_BABGI|nr:hypothetical protein BgAZ_201500 [Babesia gibsoni]
MHRDSGKRLSHSMSTRHQNSGETERDRESRYTQSATGRIERATSSVRTSRHGVHSLASSDDMTTSWYEGDLTVHDVLRNRCKNESHVTRILKYRKEYAYRSLYNSRRLGLLLLVLALINIGMFTVLFVTKNKQAECKIRVPDTTHMPDKIVVSQITPNDCSGDISQFESADKIYVYYHIQNYPHHAASIYKLHSKDQLLGKNVEMSKLNECFPYISVSSAGLDYILHPCGLHPWSIYNDLFRFSAEDPRRKPVYHKLDESEETLTKYQEYSYSKNPPYTMIDKMKKQVYYWLLDKNPTLQIHLSSMVCPESCQSLHITETRAETIKAIHRMMNTEVAGDGVQNGHFVQWMTPSPFKSFRKLYGVLEGPIKIPMYVSVRIAYDSTKFGGEKYVSIVALSWTCGNLASLRTLLLVLWILCLLGSIPLLVKKPGDVTSVVNLL